MMKKLFLFIVIFSGQSQETKALSLYTGVKCEISRINANHIVGSFKEIPYDAYMDWPKTVNKTGWGFLFFAETNRIKFFRFEAGFGLKRANIEQIIYTWVEDVVKRNLYIYYAILPITGKIEINHYLPDIIFK